MTIHESKKRVMITLTPAQHRDIKVVAAENNMTTSEVIIYALKELGIIEEK